MRPQDAARLYWVRLRGRSVFVQEALAVLGIAIGVALLFASHVLSTSLGSSVRPLTSAIAGRAQLQLRARSIDGFDEGKFTEVQRLPGVRSAVPILERGVSLIGDKDPLPVDLIATDPRYVGSAGGVLQGLVPELRRELLKNFSRRARSARSRATAGEPIGAKLVLLPPIARAIGISSPAHVGVQVGGQIASPVAAVVVHSARLDPLLGSRVALAPLGYAQQLTGMQGKLTRILVQAQPGREAEVRLALRRLAAGRQNVEPADFDAKLFDQAATPVNQSTSTFAGICALIGFMFAYCSMLLAAGTRKRLIKDLHVVGATRGQIIQALLFDAFALGGLGCVLGLAFGNLLSALAFDANPGFLSLAFPISSERIVTWQSVALAVTAGLLAACVGVLAPLWDVSGDRVGDPGSSVSRRGLTWWPKATQGAGLICLLATTAVLFVAPGSAILGIATLIVAMFLLLPRLLGAVLNAFGRLQRPTGARSTAIALLELRAPSARIRSIAIASTAAVAVFGGVTIEASRANLQSGLDGALHGITAVADLWVIPAGSQSLAGTAPFQGPPASRLAALAGVRAAGVYRSSFLDVVGRRVWVLAPAPTADPQLPRDQFVEGGAAIANARLREGGWAIISKTLAERLHVRVGQRFTLPSPRPSSLRVAALMTNMGWPPGAVMLGSRDYVSAWESSAPTAYNVLLWPGASLSAVKREIRRLLAQEGLTGMAVQTASECEQRQLATARQGLKRLKQMTILALIAGILATAASVAAVLSQRRTRAARLKAQGLSRNMLWLALVWEGALLIGAGSLLGALFGIGGQLLLSHALVSVTGFPVAFSARLDVALKSLAVVTVVAAAVIAVPGYRTANVRPSPKL